MNIKKISSSLIILLLFFLSSLSNITVSQENIEFEELTIVVPSSGSKTLYGLNVWIHGVWQYINVSLNDYSNQLGIVFHYGETIPDDEDRDETNYYFWRYYDGNWVDQFHNSRYINQSRCSYTNNTHSFFIGVDQWANTGNWTLRIYSETLEVPSEEIPQIHAENIYVENAVIDPVLKTIPVEIDIVPFTDDFYRTNETEYFTIQNMGNMPLKLSVNYGRYVDLFQTLNFEPVLKPGDTKKFGVQVHSQLTWQPGELTITGDEIYILADATDSIIPPKRIVNIIETSVAMGLPIVLHIGRTDYELESLVGDIYFQYEKEKSLYFNEEGETLSYISGEGLINVDIRIENLQLISIYSGGDEVGSHFSINSKNNSEYPISIEFKGLRSNTTGKIYYDLETGGVHNSFYTTVQIGSIRPINNGDEDVTFYIEIAIISCFALVLSYMVYTQLKHKKRKKK